MLLVGGHAIGLPTIITIAVGAVIIGILAYRARRGSSVRRHSIDRRAHRRMATAGLSGALAVAVWVIAFRLIDGRPLDWTVGVPAGVLLVLVFSRRSARRPAGEASSSSLRHCS